MNYTESFQDFASKVSPTDLALYAGAGLILWVLFSDKLGPIKEYFAKLTSNLRKNTPNTIPTIIKSKTNNPEFLDLISSWKHTRDLAESLKCTEAVKIVDQMFPLLVPSACSKDISNENE